MAETITQERPFIAEAMTAAQMLAVEKWLAGMVGPRADMLLRPSSWNDEAAHVAAYQYGIGHGEPVYHRGSGFPEAIEKAAAWAANYQTVTRDTAIRKLALDIIDLTDRHGNCTRAMLRGRGHDAITLDTLTDLARQRAGEMAGNAPYSVEA